MSSLPGDNELLSNSDLAGLLYGEQLKLYISFGKFVDLRSLISFSVLSLLFNFDLTLSNYNYLVA